MSDDDSTKVVLVGESGVGKTCIIERFCENKFSPTPLSTIGAANATAVIYYEERALTLDIWDTAGQELYRSLNKIFYKNAKIAVLVYDITKRSTFEEVKNYWYEQIKKVNGDDIIIGIAGNKSDLFNKEEVSEKEGKEFAAQNGCTFFLTSAFQGTGIKELFRELGQQVVNKEENLNPTKPKDKNKKKNVKLASETSEEEGTNKKKKKDCC